MKVLAGVIFLALPSIGAASEWRLLPGYDLQELLAGDFAQSAGVKREANVISTDGLSWPDSKKVLVTLVRVELLGRHWIYRCIEYFNSEMHKTGESCYELQWKAGS